MAQETSITLTRLGMDPDTLEAGQQQVWRLVIQAQAEGTIPAEIFVHRVGMAGALLEGDIFECVASVSQMHELPRLGGAVSPDSQLPFYRSNQLELVLRTPEEVERVWKLIREDVALLVRNWAAMERLLAVEIVRAKEDVVEKLSTTMKPPEVISLSYHPAGTATLSSGVQGLVDPNPSVRGWLPASEAPSGWQVPGGALFFYNVTKDDALKNRFPLPEPVAGHLLTRNGILLPHGVTHLITRDTIWWLKFAPAAIPGYSRLSGQPQDGNAPWPLDYVDALNPGQLPVLLKLSVFGS